MDTSLRCQAKECGAQAYVSTFHAGDPIRQLDWCMHHFREYETKLRATAVDVIEHDWAKELTGG